MSDSQPPGVGPALSALIEQWREAAVWEHNDMSNVQSAQTFDQCANELEAALSGSVGGLNAAPRDQPVRDMGEATIYGDRICETCGQQVPRLHRCVSASPVCAAEKKGLEEKIHARSHLHDDSGTAPTAREK